MKKMGSLILAMLVCFLSVAFTASATDDTCPVEEKFSQNGSYEVETMVIESGEADYSYYKIWFPKNIAEIAGSLPIIVYCNGTGMTDEDESTVKLMTAFASWGYIAISNDHESSGNGDSASKGLDVLLSLNEDENSVFYKKADTEKIGVCGFSQGGSGAINTASEGKHHNSTMFKSICALSAPHKDLAASIFQNTPYDASKVSVPAFLVAGTGSTDAGSATSMGICPLGAGLIENMKQINNDNVIIGRYKDADHGTIQMFAQPYIIAWFNYTLLNDAFSATAFTGENAEIYSNSNWQDVYNKQSQNLPENPDPYVGTGEQEPGTTKVLLKLTKLLMKLLSIFEKLFSI